MAAKVQAGSVNVVAKPREHPNLCSARLINSRAVLSKARLLGLTAQRESP